MKIDKKAMKLYAVTNRQWTGAKTLLEQTEEALKGGITCLQLREKEMDFESFLKEAFEIGELCRKYKIPFIINDNIEVALKSGADGVHIGQEDTDIKTARKLLGENMILGVSAHNVKEALYAQENGADYLGVGAVFGSSTKTNANAISKQTIYEICQSVSIPVTAIGGINRNNILELKGTGIDGAALISAVFGASDIEKECKELLKLISQALE